MDILHLNKGMEDVIENSLMDNNNINLVEGNTNMDTLDAQKEDSKHMLDMNMSQSYAWAGALLVLVLVVINKSSE